MLVSFDQFVVEGFKAKYPRFGLLLVLTAALIGFAILKQF